MNWGRTEHLRRARAAVVVLLLWVASLRSENVNGSAPPDTRADASRVGAAQDEVGEACTWKHVDLAIPLGIKIVQYEIRGERLCVSVHSSDSTETHFEIIDQKNLKYLISGYLQEIRSGSLGSFQLGQELSTTLLSPIMAHLESGNTVLFVATDLLAALPFAALKIPGTNRYLIEEFTVAVLSDLQGFARSTKKQRITRYERFVALADPRGVGVTRLPWAAHETVEAGGAYLFSVRLTGRMSSLSNLEKTLPHMDVMHIAAHTICMPRTGEPAIPLLGEGKAGEEDRVLQRSQENCQEHSASPEDSEVGNGARGRFVDGEVQGPQRPGCESGKDPVVLLVGSGRQTLTLAAIRSLDVSNLSMIVLSGCATATSPLDCGASGMAEPFSLAYGIRESSLGSKKSLADAFLKLGVPSVVGTLWPVEDSPEIAELMISFHRTVARCEDPMLALRVAQLDAVHSESAGRFSDWAAFQIVLGEQASFPPGGQEEAEEGRGSLPRTWIVGGDRMPTLSVTGGIGGAGVGGSTGSTESRAVVSFGDYAKDTAAEPVKFGVGREAVTGIDFRRLHCSLLGFLIQNPEFAGSIESELGLIPGCLRAAECWDTLPHSFHLLVALAFVTDLRSALGEVSR